MQFRPSKNDRPVFGKLANEYNLTYYGTVVPDDQVVELSGQELPDAVRALEDYMKVEFQGLLSIEYGGGNTGVAMAAAARMGKYMVDADAAGRAVPELQFSTYYIREQPIAPFSVSTIYGDAVIVQKVADDARAEALSRFMAVGSGGLVGMADHPIRGDRLRASVIPNALSYAEQVGRALQPLDRICSTAAASSCPATLWPRREGSTKVWLISTILPSSFGNVTSASTVPSGST